MDQIKQTLKSFEPIQLADLDGVKLMNRVDVKFCLHISKLNDVLFKISNDYRILEIENEVVFNYDNIYFDTADDLMYLSHQNGKRNRYKVRLRNYVQSDINFLEIKFKNNKGRTIKERVKRESFSPVFNTDEHEFIGQSTIYSGHLLVPKVYSNFNRFTLVDKALTERITVDLFPNFRKGDKEICMNNLAIIEVKQNKSSLPALMVKALREKKIESRGFSKYCVGRALLEDQLKRNKFKPLLLKLKKENYF
jgi:hypothetical protein